MWVKWFGKVIRNLDQEASGQKVIRNLDREASGRKVIRNLDREASSRKWVLVARWVRLQAGNGYLLLGFWELAGQVSSRRSRRSFSGNFAETW